MIQENLNWKGHIDQVCNKISRTIGILAKLKHYIPRNVLLIIYNSLCLSHVSYALPVWGGASPGTYKRLVILLKKGIRHVCNAKYNSHTEILFKECKVLKFGDMYKLQCIKLMYKKIDKNIHPYLASKLPLKRDIVDIQTRQSYDVVINKHNRLLEINSLNYKVASCWNGLPFELKTNAHKSLQTFVKYVKLHFLAEYETECAIPNCYICSR